MKHTIHKHDHHFGWDNAISPVITVAPGDTVEIEAIDASGGQVKSGMQVGDLANIDWQKINPVTGPVFVDGAEPGDALKITFVDYAASGVGWAANIPGFGLLADEFPDPQLHFWKYETNFGTPAAYGPGGRVPLKPFCGTIGVAPGAPGRHEVLPPRRVGGNMDFRDLSTGVVLYLPIEAPGALLSLGDTHAVQGDGEVCGVALESPMTVTLTLDLVKGAAPAFPRVVTPGPVTRHLDAKGYEIATGIGPDLMESARNAVRGMIDVLTKEHGMSPVDAYILCSVCGDLRINEIVDRPNWVVSFYFPRVVFD
jgi:acetamidase/formamidase